MRAEIVFLVSRAHGRGKLKVVVKHEGHLVAAFLLGKPTCLDIFHEFAFDSLHQISTDNTEVALALDLG